MCTFELSQSPIGRFETFYPMINIVYIHKHHIILNNN
jgi:hypothetical protein